MIIIIIFREEGMIDREKNKRDYCGGRQEEDSRQRNQCMQIMEI